MALAVDPKPMYSSPYQMSGRNGRSFQEGKLVQALSLMILRSERPQAHHEQYPSMVTALNCQPLARLNTTVKAKGQR